MNRAAGNLADLIGGSMVSQFVAALVGSAMFSAFVTAALAWRFRRPV